MEKTIVVIAGLVPIALGWAIGFAIFAGLTWVVCWSFDLEFTWKYALGIWIIWIFVRGMFKTNVTVKREETTSEQWDRIMRRR